MAKTTADFKYTVFERGNLGWYFQYLVGEGKRSPMLSVKRLVKKMGLTEEYPKLKSRRMCERIVVLGYERGYIKVQQGSREKLADYLTEYWNFTGDRIRRANRRRKGRSESSREESISENYASIMQGYIKNHIVPRIPKQMALGDVTPKMVRDISNRLIDDGKLANATVDKIMTAFTQPLRVAYKTNLIHEDPVRLVEHVDTKPERQRGILTRSEFQAVLVLLKTKATEHVYLAVLLAAATGMRLGEIRALYASDINVVNEQDAIIQVSKSWSVKGGEKSTKGKKDRYTPCPAWLANKLIALAKKNARGSSLVFWSLSDTAQLSPVSTSYIREKFYEHLWPVLESQAGIEVGTMVEDTDATARGKFDKEGKPIKVCSGEMMRRERNIDFHSFRHFFNTEAQALGADGDKLRLTVGHESQSMTDKYTHQSYDMVKSIADISHQIVGEAEVVE